MKAGDFRKEFFDYLRMTYGAQTMMDAQSLPPMRVQGNYPAFRPTVSVGALSEAGLMGGGLPGMLPPLTSAMTTAPGVMREQSEPEQVRELNDAAGLLSGMR